MLLIEQNSKLGLRAKEYNPINGREVRLWDGKPLTFSDGSYSITSSTSQSDNYFVNVFHLYLPLEMAYGYNSPADTIHLAEDTILTIRTYSEKHNHQQARHRDNSFRLGQLINASPLPVPASARPYSRFSLKELRAQLDKDHIVTEETLQKLFGDNDYKLQENLQEHFLHTLRKKTNEQ